MKVKIITLLLTGVLGISLTACSLFQPSTAPETETPTAAQAITETAAPTEEPTDPPTEAPVIGAPEDYVVTDQEYQSLYSGTFTITGEDAYQEPHEVTDRLPRLTLDSSDAQAINEQIHADCDQEFANNEQAAFSGYASRTDYVAYVNGSVLSLIIETRSVNTPCSFFFVYNIDVLTGESLSKDDILARAGVTYDDAIAQVSSDIESKFSEAIGNGIDESLTVQPKAESLDPDNLAGAQFWFDAEGVLCASYRYVWMAGASSYGAVYRLDAHIQ